MQFYPNQQLQMTSVGDLCHHTPYAIEKEEDWITDKLGFRNDHFIEEPDVVLVGDSFMVGAALPQDSTLTNLLKAKAGDLQFYNMAPSTFSGFIRAMENGTLRKPKVLIFEIAERSSPPIIQEETVSNQQASISDLEIFIDRATRMYGFNYLKARLTNSKGPGVQGIGGSHMFFHKGINQEYQYDEIENVAKTIVSYKAFCESENIEFIFLPLPNKETVYYSVVPFDSQPNYLLKLDSILSSKGVTSINTLELFNKTSQLVYHLDDTHWNSTGVDIVADQLVEVVNEKIMLQ